MSSAKEKRLFDSLKELAVLLATMTSIFVALLYLAGRSFASGYFAAMNIPEYQVSFSLWEYGAVAWLPMITYPILMLGAASLFWGIVYMLRDWLSPTLMHFINWLRRFMKFMRLTWSFPSISEQTRRWFALAAISVLGLFFIFVVVNTLRFVEGLGQLNGQNIVLEKAAQVELVFKSPMDLDDNNLLSVQSNGRDYYIYKGFHLLTVNNGRYYLFSELDPITCKPTKVYVIEAGLTLQINLLPAVSLENQCQKNATDHVIITPTAISTVQP